MGYMMKPATVALIVGVMHETDIKFSQTILPEGLAVISESFPELTLS